MKPKFNVYNFARELNLCYVSQIGEAKKMSQEHLVILITLLCELEGIDYNQNKK